ncbi:MAG: HAD-IA family hydrolase [Pseudomonadota bacterium]
MTALFFGSIGTVIETSEHQREAFNQAFAVHGLEWHWDRDLYREMLQVAGGANRIARYAKQHDEVVDVAALHATKTSIFQNQLASKDLPLRPGVARALQEATARGVPCAFVTSTEADTAWAIAKTVAWQAGVAFDHVTHSKVGQPSKPAPDVYRAALAALDLSANDATAIEDNSDGVAAAKAAGLVTIGYPGLNTFARDLTKADAQAGDDIAIALDRWLLRHAQAAE